MTRIWVTIFIVCAFVGAAMAQCPGGLGDPLNLISNTTWAFQTEDGAAGDGTIGVFTAQAVPNPRTPAVLIGVLKVTQTFNNSGATQERVASPGVYQIAADCSGGVLWMPGPYNAYQYAFVFADSMTKMLLVTSNPTVPNNGAGPLVGNRGMAMILAAPPSCPAGDPNLMLTGSWSFLVRDWASATAGIMKAQVGTTSRAPGVNVGLLNIVETVSGGGNVNRVGQTVPGDYQMYPDCSGGNLHFDSGAANSYSFIFAGPNLIFMLANSVNGSTFNNTGGSFRASYGQAYR